VTDKHIHSTLINLLNTTGMTNLMVRDQVSHPYKATGNITVRWLI